MEVNFINESSTLLQSSAAARIVIPIKGSRITIGNVNYIVSDIRYNYDFGTINIHLKLFKI